MTNKFSRRTVLQTTAAVGVLSTMGMPAFAGPRHGGTFRMGISGAHTSDTWDSRTHSDIYMINVGSGCVFETLTEVSAEGELIGELALSWEASPDVKIWTFNLRKNVKFHNGASFGADDVIASMNMHVEDGSKSAAKPIVAAIAEMKKMNSHQVQFILKAGSADFPYLMSDFHLCIFPAGMIPEAIAKGIGTGPYQVVSFDPGVRTLAKKFDGHYKADTVGYFAEIEAIAISDASARISALVSGQVDAITHVDIKSLPLLKLNPKIEIVEVTGNLHGTFPMLVNSEPFGDVNVRKAIKFAANRQEMVDKVFLGHGAVGNDHPIGPANQYIATEITQTEYDPDKSKFYLKKAGMSELSVDLHVSDAAFTGATDAALLYQNSAKKAGININVIREPKDGYWSNVWLKKPWCAAFWSGRPTEDGMFTAGYERGVPWNDTGWDDDRFQTLLLQGRTELDTNTRREIYTEMQKLCSEEGGVVIPIFQNFIDAISTKIAHGPTTGNLWVLDSGRSAKRWWMA